MIIQPGEDRIAYAASPDTTPLRIAFLIDTFAIGGSELNAIKLAEALVRRDVALTVFHFQPDGPLRSRYTDQGIELIHIPLHGLVSRSAFAATRNVRRLARSRGAQLLHTHCVYSNIVGAGVRRLGVHTLPLLVSRRWTGYADRSGLHTLNAVAQSAADAVLVNSPGLAQLVKQESRFAKPTYIPNLLPENNFSVVDARDRQRRRIAVGLPATGIVAGCVARLVPVKDHRTLLTAWRSVLDELPSATLAIIGGGDMRASLEVYAKELNMEGRVVFTGEVSPDSLPHSVLDLTVLTSIDEGFPNSLLEAMAQRVPVISTAVGGVTDLVSDGVNGVLVTKGDAIALARAIKEVLTNREKAAELVAQATKTATSHTETAVMKSLFKLYRTIARP